MVGPGIGPLGARCESLIWLQDVSEASEEESFALSRQTSRFDAFLSHDWGTSRWLKLLAMLVVFNAKAAAVAATTVSVLSSPIALAFQLEDALGPMLLCFATFWLFLCFWQRIRQLLRFPLMVFMDKLCISQHNAHLKERDHIYYILYDYTYMLWRRFHGTQSVRREVSWVWPAS